MESIWKAWNVKSCLIKFVWSLLFVFVFFPYTEFMVDGCGLAKGCGYMYICAYMFFTLDAMNTSGWAMGGRLHVHVHV